MVFMIPNLLKAQYVIYTDRSAWEAALASAPANADFSSITTDADICQGAVTAGSYTLEPISCNSGSIFLDVTDNGTSGLLSGIDQINLGGTTSGSPKVKISIPSSSGIGFDWKTTAITSPSPYNSLWIEFTNSAGTFTYNLNQTVTSGFFGIISQCGQLKSYNLYSPMTNFQGFSAGSFSHCTASSTYTPPTTPTLNSTSTIVCGTQSITLSITSGSLNDATKWVWYAGTCGSNKVGEGTSLTLTPTATTTYYARGESSCGGGLCGSIDISVFASINYEDYDKDGYGNASVSSSSCPPPTGYISLAGDCNDSNSKANPSATEISGNGIDDNCNGQTDEGTYCIPTTSSIACQLFYITNVTTTGGITNINNSSKCAANSYTYYQNHLASQVRGGSVTFNITNYQVKGPTLNYSVWIDFNDNAKFESGEKVISASTSASFQVPNNAPAGFHRMRIRADDRIAPNDPCNRLILGETEDYIFTVVVCTDPTLPTLNANFTSICGNQSSTLTVSAGTLNSATNWKWYSGSCGGTLVGTGTSVTVSPKVTTTYYARGEGGCVTPGACASITITVTGPGKPSSENIIAGNQSISTQTEMDAFFNSINGFKWTKVAGDLTITGNSTTDPITNFCNLSALTEVTGYLLIQQFTQAVNPTNLDDLAALTKTGRFTIITNSQFQTIILPELTQVNGSLNIRNNRFATSISLPKFSVLEAERLMIIRNPRTQIIQLSNQASSFTFTHPQNNTNVDIQYNGDSSSNALTIDLNKITSLGRHLTFINNDNSGVSNFDNIFSGLTTVSGNITITGNSYLSKCCIAASTAVSGTRTISGNTGNCADLTAVVSDCGTLNKKQSTPGMSPINTDLFSLLKIYPSPNKGKFEIEVTTTQIGQLNITVTDLLGRALLNQSQTVDGTVVVPVNMDKVADGQYIIKLELNGNVVIKRVQIIK